MRQWCCPGRAAEVAADAAQVLGWRHEQASAPSEPARKVVFLLRHGRTALNAAGVLRGRLDVPLDEVGRAEADRLGALFGMLDLARLVSSPLRRARQTAAPIAAATGAAVTLEPAFGDRDVGAWSGTATAEVVARFGTLDQAPGVERREDFQRRVLTGWRLVTAGPAGGPVAIVTHEAVIGCLLELLTAAPPQAGRLPAGSWSQLELRGGRWTAVVVGAVPSDGRQPLRRGA